MKNNISVLWISGQDSWNPPNQCSKSESRLLVLTNTKSYVFWRVTRQTSWNKISKNNMSWPTWRKHRICERSHHIMTPWDLGPWLLVGTRRDKYAKYLRLHRDHFWSIFTNDWIHISVSINLSSFTKVINRIFVSKICLYRVHSRILRLKSTHERGISGDSADKYTVKRDSVGHNND